MTLLAMRALVRFFFASVGLSVIKQEDGSLLVREDNGACWRVTVERMP